MGAPDRPEDTFPTRYFIVIIIIISDGVVLARNRLISLPIPPPIGRPISLNYSEVQVSGLSNAPGFIQIGRVTNVLLAPSKF